MDRITISMGNLEFYSVLALLGNAWARNENSVVDTVAGYLVNRR